MGKSASSVEAVLRSHAGESINKALLGSVALMVLRILVYRQDSPSKGYSTQKWKILKIIYSLSCIFKPVWHIFWEPTLILIVNFFFSEFSFFCITQKKLFEKMSQCFSPKQRKRIPMLFCISLFFKISSVLRRRKKIKHVWKDKDELSL